MSQQFEIERHRDEARLFIDALAERLGELERLAAEARRFDGFSPADYAEFKTLFLNFRDLSEEFQLLSHLAEGSLSNFAEAWHEAAAEQKELDEHFRHLQVPMLQGVIATNLRLLKVWDDRVQRGEGLPYGAYELFLETVRIIHAARAELRRPRYGALLDDTALRDADRAERLLRILLDKAPRLFDFLREDDGMDDTLAIRSITPETATAAAA